MNPKTNRSPLLLVLLLTLLAQCSKDNSGISASFSITTISPQSGAVGTTVIITGKGFGSKASDNKVFFNGKEATVTNVSATELTVQVPTAATTGPVSVQTGTNTTIGPVFTVTELKATKTYYIKFKADGVVKIFEDGNPGYQSCGQCACSVIPPLSDTNGNLSICQANNNFITAANIENWNGKKILWSDTTFPYSSLSFKENAVSYASYNVIDQSGSELNITKVESDGLFVTKKIYKVTGTFKCRVAKSDGSSVTTITEGEFVVRYSED
jgi:hypothetical protein